MVTEKPRKYFVNHKETVAIQCRGCGRIRTVSTESLKSKSHIISINCPCTTTFEVTLEFRRDYREKTNIIGWFRAPSTPRARARQCIIADQSNGGLLLHVTQEVPVKKNDYVIVSYRPEHTDQEEIEKIINVRHYEPGHRIGGAFIQPPRDARPVDLVSH